MDRYKNVSVDTSYNQTLSPEAQAHNALARGDIVRVKKSDKAYAVELSDAAKRDNRNEYVDIVE